MLKKASRQAASPKGMPNARQVMPAGRDYFFTGHEAELVQEVKTFLDSLRWRTHGLRSMQRGDAIILPLFYSISAVYEPS